VTSENPLQHPHHPPTSWDIFCRVIDNHGDLGVCWRLSADLAQRGHPVRLWVDDVSALSWMAPQALRAQQGESSSFAPNVRAPASVQVMQWQDHAQASAPHDLVVEAFGCELPEHFQQLIAKAPHTVWVNLEYLSAEDYVARQHGLPSPVMHGPAKGATKWFFYPGFSSDTGGLLREPDLLQRQSAFDKAQWLQQWSFNKPLADDERLMSLFCYEPEALKDLLQQLAQGHAPTRLLVTAGRAQLAVREVLPALESNGLLTVEWLPYMSQTEFDHLLWACDMNFVRGEDSLVRALWAGKPWVWQIYPQDDLAHHAKLQALCDKLQMPADLQAFQRRWNQVTTTPLAPLTRAVLDAWGVWSRQTQQLLMQQTDLTKQLIEFTRQKR
jgi:uncharacterized repeat protein (TIGR03837 family)